MSMVYCPECHSRISDKATICPVCGFSASAEGSLVPLGSLPPACEPVRILAPDAEIFDGGTTLIPLKARRALTELLKDAKKIKELAPSVSDAIQNAMAAKGTVWAADFSTAAQKMMDSGELVLSVERKTGELLPQLRSVETGRVYEKARLHIEQLPDNLASSLASVQLQLSMAELLSEIRDVAYGVERLHLESRGDRIAGAKAVWCQLEQASSIQDGRLRQQRVLDIAGAATEQRCILQENFSVQYSLASGSGKTKQRGSAAREAIVNLSAASLMARTECAAYSIIEEPEAARAALEQFGGFIADNRLGDIETLRKLNSVSDKNMEETISSFRGIAVSVNNLLSDGGYQQARALSEPEESEGNRDETL